MKQTAPLGVCLRPIKSIKYCCIQRGNNDTNNITMCGRSMIELVVEAHGDAPVCTVQSAGTTGGLPSGNKKHLPAILRHPNS